MPTEGKIYYHCSIPNMRLINLSFLVKHLFVCSSKADEKIFRSHVAGSHFPRGLQPMESDLGFGKTLFDLAGHRSRRSSGRPCSSGRRRLVEHQSEFERRIFSGSNGFGEAEKRPIHLHPMQIGMGRVPAVLLRPQEGDEPDRLFQRLHVEAQTQKTVFCLVRSRQFVERCGQIVVTKITFSNKMIKSCYVLHYFNKI